ncbi:hypothetical protein [Devosia sp.]|uniref:hypothetical protein n=1 Tax=Devosia sp. TaxID=1871048 RepID=UPI003A902F91
MSDDGDDPRRTAKQTAGKRDEATQPQKKDPIRRQAVVVVHGQGQQRPMETLRAIVDGLLPPGAATTANGEPRYYIVPDELTGSFELHRITTPTEAAQPGQPGNGARKTDFFELYYADLLADTPFRNLANWLRGLLALPKSAISPSMKQLLLLVSTVLFLCGLMIIWALLAIPSLMRAQLCLTPVSLIALGAIVPLLAAFAFLPLVHRWRYSLVALIIFLANVAIFPTTQIFAPLSLIGLGVYLLFQFGLPVFGDAAVYLKAQVETVGPRARIRERGLKLLEGLHNSDRYDRIIIVAHSLGTVLAYDLLQIFWQRVGPTKLNPPSAAAMRPLRNVRNFVTSNPGDWTPEQRQKYQDLQWQAFLALGPSRPKPQAEGAVPPSDAETTPNQPWKISDFVSLGTPLGHARMLIADGPDHFEKMRVERLLSMSPPVDYDAVNHPEWGFLDEGAKATHHAAVFSVVRWTNLTDTHEGESFFYSGDFISSIVGEPDLFGKGIVEKDTKMRDVPGSGFTHGKYWIEIGAKGDETAPEMLRNAVGLKR